MCTQVNLIMGVDRVQVTNEFEHTQDFQLQVEGEHLYLFLVFMWKE